MSNHSKFALEDPFRKMFPEEWLRITARETCLIIHERKIDPAVIFWVLTLSFGVCFQRTLASLKHQYEKEAKTILSDRSLYYRFTSELVEFLLEFLYRCASHCTEECTK